jgi:TniQ
MTADAGPPQPLPIRPRPMSGESPASYLRRLARANHLRPAYLRRYLRQPGSPETIRLDWLAVLAGRSLPALERALTGHQAGAGRQHVRQADKPGLFAAIRRDARDSGLSIRALADRHGVHRRTVRQALASPWPARRKPSPPRRSRLDPFKGVIDAMLSVPQAADKAPITARQIHARLVSEHGMASVSYSTVRSYVAGRFPARQLTAWDARALRNDARQAVTHLKEALEAMHPGIVARLRPHLDALELVIKQEPEGAGSDARDAEPDPARRQGREHA